VQRQRQITQDLSTLLTHCSDVRPLYTRLSSQHQHIHDHTNTAMAKILLAEKVISQSVWHVQNLFEILSQDIAEHYTKAGQSFRSFDTNPVYVTF